MIPKPVYDVDSKIFWEGLKEHKLLIQRCTDCQKTIFYPRLICPHCFSDQVEWIEASGKGKIYSYTIVYQTTPAFRDQVPYAVGMIELEEGVRMVSRIIGDLDKIAIDKPVSVVFEKIDDELTLPYFKLDEPNL